MTDTEVVKREQMENLDETNYIGDISCNSKELDAENVDAIKKYIEEQEQEILLKHSTSVNDLDSQINKQTSIGANKTNCEFLQQQITCINDPDLITDILAKSKETMVLSPNNVKSVLKDLEESVPCDAETKKIQSQISFVNNSVSEVENEENLEHQNVTHAQTNINIKELEQLDHKLNVDDQELVSKCVVGLVPKLKEEVLYEAQENIHNFGINNCGAKYDELRSIQGNKNVNLQFSKTNQPIICKLDSSESKDAKLLKCSVESELENMETMALKGSECNDAPRLLHQLLTATNTLENEIKKSEELKRENANKNKEHSEETLAIASSVMDMILSDTEAAINKKKVCSVLSKQLISPEKVYSSVSLAIGSKVEAKDFSEMWYPAQIIEVDCEEMEVLVEYDNQPKKHSEWISISSPRLRPISSCASKEVLPAAPQPVNTHECISEQKSEEKQKVTFAIGERCLARWRDNRRFIATIQNVLQNGSYEVMFDDGFVWKCPLSRLYKLKESSKHDFPSFTSAAPAQARAPPAPAAPLAPGAARVPFFHTHLFDPTRDYLGSKSERREMKRKLNIKEIFNIGQKRKKPGLVDKESKSTTISTKPAVEVKSETAPDAASAASDQPLLTNSMLELKHPTKKKPVVRKKPFMRKKIKLKIKSEKGLPDINEEQHEIPVAVAAIIGTVCESEPVIDEIKLETPALETKDSNANDIKLDEVTHEDFPKIEDTTPTLDERNMNIQIKEEIGVGSDQLDNETGVKHEEVIGKIKEAITKLEDGINEVEQNDAKPAEVKKEATAGDEVEPPSRSSEAREKRRKSSKAKKGKKLKLMREKKVKKEVAKVKCELEEMKRQVEAMRREILLKTEALGARGAEGAEGAGALLPGEWCCRWVDGQPAGAVSEVECDARGPAHPDKPPLPRRSVQVEDNRLPPGWTKHMVRRSLGHSAGKWDVVLVSPENRRFHTKNDMRVYLENSGDEALRPFEAALTDFGIHLKLARRLGWVSSGGAPPPPPAPPAASSPLLKRRKLSLHTHKDDKHRNRKELRISISRAVLGTNVAHKTTESDVCPNPVVDNEATLDGASIKDGFVHVGSLKVQVIETLLRCPAEGCFKNFRNTTLLKMHIKHYHRDLRKMMGVTPKVLDLAYARTRPTEAEMKRLKCEAQNRIIKVKLPRLHQRAEEPRAPEPAEAAAPATAPAPPAPPAPATPPPQDAPARPQDSPKLRDALANKPAKRPKVLLPVRNPEPEPEPEPESEPEPEPGAVDEAVAPLECAMDEEEGAALPRHPVPEYGPLDFETAISSHTVARLAGGRRRLFAALRGGSEEEGGSEPDSRSSHSGATAADDDLLLALSSDSTDDKHNMYMFTEHGERIKLVRMKREEIINCHCGFREEDGLMVQCELCLCWQHALCHNIQREAEVPEKYTCSICLNPRRGRRRLRFTHDQDRLYEGLLPAGAGGRASEPLRRAHELAGNLLRAADALHAARVNAHVAAKKNHPKLYLWAKDWETVELTFAQEQLNSEYSDLNVIINSLGKENLPIKAEDIKDMAVDTKSEPLDDREEKTVKKECQTDSQSLLPGILSSPGGVSLDLPVSESEIEKLAKSVQAASRAPQPEAAIENGACRARVLRHVQRCHALLDQRLDSIEAQVAELESQDPSLEDDESADFCPRAKQTVVMMLRDLDAMEELGMLT